MLIIIYCSGNSNLNGIKAVQFVFPVINISSCICDFVLTVHVFFFFSPTPVLLDMPFVNCANIDMDV